MAFEIIVSACLIALCALTGRRMAMKYVDKANEVRRMQEDIKRLKNGTIDKKLPLKNALMNLEGGAYGRIAGKMEADSSVTLSEAFMEQGGEGDGFSEENACLQLLFESLENLNRQDQAAQYERALEDLKRLEEEKRKKGLEKVRLYTSLGALLGAVCVIFTL